MTKIPILLGIMRKCFSFSTYPLSVLSHQPYAGKKRTCFPLTI